MTELSRDPAPQRFPYTGHDRGVVVTQPRNGEFEERPMTVGELAARVPALKIAKDIFRHANQAGVCYSEIWRLIADAIDAAPVSARRTHVPIKVRPMLVSGILATNVDGPMILIDSEQDEHQQVVALWHETLHLLGLTDEFLVDEYAMRLAETYPDILKHLKDRINVPEAAQAASGELERLREYQAKVQEAEGRVCPEDVGFEEYIRHLLAKLALSAENDAGREELLREATESAAYWKACATLSTSAGGVVDGGAKREGP